MIALPERKRRKHEESDVIARIRRRAAKLDWCVCWRSNTGAFHDETGRLVTFGLCEGAADLVGIVRLDIHAHDGRQRPMVAMGRFWALEVKRPGKKPTDLQLAFLAVVRSMGGFATWVDNDDAAMVALERARDPMVSE